jgi:hypothetical protein
VKRRELTILLVPIALTALLALLLTPVPIQTRIIEGKTTVPPRFRYIIKLCLFNMTFELENFTLEVTIENETYNFKCDYALFLIRSWRTNQNTTLVKVHLTLHKVYGSNTQFEFYFDSLYLDFDIEISENETCTVYGYAETSVPLITILFNRL